MNSVNALSSIITLQFIKVKDLCHSLGNVLCWSCRGEAVSARWVQGNRKMPSQWCSLYVSHKLSPLNMYGSYTRCCTFFFSLLNAIIPISSLNLNVLFIHKQWIMPLVLGVWVWWYPGGAHTIPCAVSLRHGAFRSCTDGLHSFIYKGFAYFDLALHVPTCVAWNVGRWAGGCCFGLTPWFHFYVLVLRELNSSFKF